VSRETGFTIGPQSVGVQADFVRSGADQTRHALRDVYPVRTIRPASIIRKPTIAKTVIETFVPDLRLEIEPSL